MVPNYQFICQAREPIVFEQPERASTSRNRRSENVVIEAVVVAELKFGDVERHIFGADLVERADDAALEDAPEAERLRRRNPILLCGSMDCFARNDVRSNRLV
jgi:hypothetical protein